MDVPRQNVSRRKWIRRALALVVLVVAVPLVTWGLSRLKPAAPTVERSSVWPDTVKRGEMLRQVRGLGTLIPEEVLLIPAVTDGRVDKIVIRPGTAVRPDSIIVELSNPEVELAAEDFRWQVKAAEANLADLRVKLETQRLEQRSRAAQVQADLVKAKLAADRDVELLRSGLTADITSRTSKATAEELVNRSEIENKRLEIMDDSIKAQIAAQEVQIQKLEASYVLKRKQVDQLKVRAGVAGMLQQISIEVGQRVTAGTQLAKVAQPEKLKAELKIPETQAKDVILGQTAEIDTRNGIIPGRVSRIDPAVINGTVTIDVRLVGALPAGARPDLSVDGTVELERLQNVMFVSRPVFGQPNSTISLFKVDPQTSEAHRVPVRVGRVSVNTIEILDGLRVGDQVILSDMSNWDSHDRVRLQ